MDWIFTIVIILVVVWLVGFLLKIGGKFIHLILVVALSFFVLKLLGVI